MLIGHYYIIQDLIIKCITFSHTVINFIINLTVFHRAVIKMNFNH